MGGVQQHFGDIGPCPQGQVLPYGRQVTSNKAVLRVTQRVPLADVEDLFSRPARAAVAWAGPAGPECVPVVAERDGGIRIGLYPGAIPATGAARRARRR